MDSITIQTLDLDRLMRDGDPRFEFTQIFNWLHIKDRETGEGWWVWNPLTTTSAR